jgi:hypothetical protein
MAAKVYGATTVGPQNWRRGKQFVISAYSNKGHDGFRKLSGEWCNIGADSNNSNLRTTI